MGWVGHSDYQAWVLGGCGLGLLVSAAARVTIQITAHGVYGLLIDKISQIHAYKYASMLDCCPGFPSDCR